MTTHFTRGKYREEDRVTGPSGEMHECQLAAVPGPLRGEFVMVTSLPWVSMGVGTTVESACGSRALLEAWLDYLDGRQGVTIDFTR